MGKWVQREKQKENSDRHIHTHTHTEKEIGCQGTHREGKRREEKESFLFVFSSVEKKQVAPNFGMHQHTNGMVWDGMRCVCATIHPFTPLREGERARAKKG